MRNAEVQACFIMIKIIAKTISIVSGKESARRRAGLYHWWHGINKSNPSWARENPINLCGFGEAGIWSQLQAEVMPEQQ